MRTEQVPVVVSGENLSLERLVDVARAGAPAAISDSPKVRKAIQSSRRALERALEEGEVIYGINTGFGENAKFLIPKESVDAHQENVLRALACGVGPPLADEVVRGAMLLRINSFCKGFSAIRMLLIERLVDLLNAGIVPRVPLYGSVGASGDLIPSAHISRALLGKGKVFYQGREQQASEALDRAGLSPLDLKAKEGIALVNGTTVMTSTAALALFDLEYLSRLSLATVALSVESLHSVTNPFEETVQIVKNHPGQLEVARFLRALLEGSTFVRDLESLRTQLKRDQADSDSTIEVEAAIQDPYSLRCTPQGFGPVFESLTFARTVIEREMNSVNDNPLVDPHSGRVLHTGNFFGGHVARIMDGLKIDMVILANWLHALMAMLVDPRFSRGLPPSLSTDPGRNSGFKPMQLCLSSLVRACRQMAGPSLIHALPTEQYNQDMVSLGLMLDDWWPAT